MPDEQTDCEIPDVSGDESKLRCERAFEEGVRAGLYQYAWWKDGVLMVGTCCTTLEYALWAFAKGGRSWLV